MQSPNAHPDNCRAIIQPRSRPCHKPMEEAVRKKRRAIVIQEPFRYHHSHHVDDSGNPCYTNYKYTRGAVREWDEATKRLDTRLSIPLYYRKHTPDTSYNKVLVGSAWAIYDKSESTSLVELPNFSVQSFVHKLV